MEAELNAPSTAARNVSASPVTPGIAIAPISALTLGRFRGPQATGSKGPAVSQLPRPKHKASGAFPQPLPRGEAQGRRPGRQPRPVRCRARPDARCGGCRVHGRVRWVGSWTAHVPRLTRTAAARVQAGWRDLAAQTPLSSQQVLPGTRPSPADKGRGRLCSTPDLLSNVSFSGFNGTHAALPFREPVTCRVKRRGHSAWAAAGRCAARGPGLAPRPCERGAGSGTPHLGRKVGRSWEDVWRL